jgi:hypothetical protein
MTIGSNLISSGSVSIGSQQSTVNIKTDSVSSGAVNIMTGSLTGGNINIGKYTSTPYPTWTNTTIDGAVDIGNANTNTRLFGNVELIGTTTVTGDEIVTGTLKTNFIDTPDANGEIIIGSSTGTIILSSETTATTQTVGTGGNLIATCDYVINSGGFNPNTTQITPTYTPLRNLTKLGGFDTFRSVPTSVTTALVILCPTTFVPNGYYMVSVTIQVKPTFQGYYNPSFYLYSSTSQQVSYAASQTNVAGDASTYGMNYPTTFILGSGIENSTFTLTQTGNVWVGTTIDGTVVGNYLAIAYTQNYLSTTNDIQYTRMVLTRLA